MSRPVTREEPSVVIAARVEPDLARRLREAAKRSESTPSAITSELLVKHLPLDTGEVKP